MSRPLHWRTREGLAPSPSSLGPRSRTGGKAGRAAGRPGPRALPASWGQAPGLSDCHRSRGFLPAPLKFKEWASPSKAGSKLGRRKETVPGLSYGGHSETAWALSGPLGSRLFACPSRSRLPPSCPSRPSVALEPISLALCLPVSLG